MNIMIVILAISCPPTIEQSQYADIETAQCILTVKKEAIASIEADLKELIVLSSTKSEHSIVKQIWWNVIKTYIPLLPRPKS